ncbi:MAG: NmrA family NAD(P)-binding protein [Kofleriaceae bacterium]
MYAIAGVTGHTGSVVARTLLDQGHPIRVIVRDAAKGAPWQARGAEVAIATVEDRHALARALAGVEGAYLLLPPGAPAARSLAAGRAAQITAISAAVREARPGWVVLLSSVGANLAAGTGPIQYLHGLENALRETGVPAIFLRAAFFMENWGGSLASALATGALHYGIRSDVKLPQVATADIGRTAARLLVEPPPKGARVVEIEGPAPLTLDETAAVLGKVAGKPVRAVSIPPEAQVEALVGLGMSREEASLLGEMSTAVNEGRLAWEGHEHVVGTVTLEQRLRELLAAR